jgi:hypothetical protein
MSPKVPAYLVSLNSRLQEPNIARSRRATSLPLVGTTRPTHKESGSDNKPTNQSNKHVRPFAQLVSPSLRSHSKIHRRIDCARHQ